MKEEELKNKFKSELLSKGYRVVKEFNNNPPDMIVEKDRDYIAVELKGSGRSSIYGVSVGQLLFAKSKYNIKNLWLILPEVPSFSSKEWIILLLSLGINIFCFLDGKFIKFTPELWQKQMIQSIQSL